MTATLSTRSNTTFRTLSIAVAAMIGTAVSFGATTSPAHADTGSYYTAKLATPVKSLKTVSLGDTVWSCEGGECRAPRDGSRTVVSCERLATKFGGVEAFTAQGAALGADDLTKCNHKVAGDARMASAAHPKH